MKYFVRIGEEEHEVVLDAEGVHLDGEDVAAQVASIDGTPVRMVTIGDEVHRVVVRPGRTMKKEIPARRSNANLVERRSRIALRR